MEEYYSDRPVLDPGEVVSSADGDYSFRVIEHIGEGRCCLVYSARSVRDGTKVALKVYKRGPNYDGAVQREQYILDAFQQPSNKIVLCFGYFVYNGLHCQVMELLEYNIRQLIFRNDRQGLSPWLTQKCARDLLTSLAALHDNSFVHADLKPANVMWSSYDGCFKLLDFGLTFHTEESDLHQIQSSGYKAPESAEWNKFKDDEKRKRKRKLQGTYSDLTTAAPAFSDGLNEISESANVSQDSAKDQQNTQTVPLQSNSSTEDALVEHSYRKDISERIMQNSTKTLRESFSSDANEQNLTPDALSPSSSCSSSFSTASGSRRKPPPKHRLSCAIPAPGGGSELEIYVRPPRQKRTETDQCRLDKHQDVVSPTLQAECQEGAENTNKWPSESSGIFTASSQCQTPSISTSVADGDYDINSRTELERNNVSSFRNDVISPNNHVTSNSQFESNASITSFSSIVTSGSSQSYCHSINNKTPTTEGCISYSHCDVQYRNRRYIDSETSSRTSLDPSLSSLTSCTSNTCSSSIVSPSTSQSCCSSSSKSKVNAESAYGADQSQEWRRGRSAKKDASGRKCPRPVSTHVPKLEERKSRPAPIMPNEKADIWSFGCLLVEALTGRKMFSASDKMASVLRPLQLLEMRIGETECKYHNNSDNQSDEGKNLDRHKFFEDAKSLIQSCLAEDPTDRISAKSALQHKFFADHDLLPSLKDMVLLPTNVLRLLNVLDDPKYKNDDEIKEMLTEVREEAEKFGRVTDIKANGGHAYVEFQEASDCQRAVNGLTGTSYEDRTLMAVFYPICLWSQNILLL